MRDPSHWPQERVHATFPTDARVRQNAGTCTSRRQLSLVAVVLYRELQVRPIADLVRGVGGQPGQGHRDEALEVDKVRISDRLRQSEAKVGGSHHGLRDVRVDDVENEESLGG